MSAIITTPAISSNNKKRKEASDSNGVVIFGHHPCPDGLAGLVVLAEQYGMDDLTTYAGLNHAAQAVMQKQIEEAIKTQKEGADIIFLDIIPPFAILKFILETTKSKVILLDHHATAITALKDPKNAGFLEPFIKSGRLRMDLDLERSGVGIAYREVHQNKSLPNSILLIQTLDLLTATGDPKVIEQFKIQKEALSKKHQELFESIAKKVGNEQIANNIEFYLLATILDIEFKTLFSKYEKAPLKTLIQAAKLYIEALEKEGVCSLLDKVIIINNAKESAESLFWQQVEYQKTAIKKATTISFAYRPEMRVLFIQANMQSGRTFDPLISEALSKLPQPAIAMITNATAKTATETNWISLRTIDGGPDLTEIAEQFKSEQLSGNGGGHARASALQFNQKQFSEPLNLIAKTVQVQLNREYNQKQFFEIIISVEKLIHEQLNQQKLSSESRVIFGHHPCTGAIAAMAILLEKFGSSSNITYSGLDHDEPKRMLEAILEALKTQAINAEIIFVGIVPPMEILIGLLKSGRKIILIDRHQTAKYELNHENNRAALEPYIKSSQLTSHISLDRTSSAEIAHVFAHGTKPLPAHIVLAKAIALFTTTADSKVVQDIKINNEKFFKESKALSECLSKLNPNSKIVQHLDFYLLALAYDACLSQLFSEYNNPHQYKDLIIAVKRLYQDLQEKGVSELLNRIKLADQLLARQINYQLKAIAAGITIPSLHSSKMQVLFIQANMRSGRTFDTLIEEALLSGSLSFAMIAPERTQVSLGTCPVSLRTASDQINLAEIARMYKEQGYVENGGGHARASALQFSQEQYAKLLDIAEKNKKVVVSVPLILSPGTKPVLASLKEAAGSKEAAAKETLQADATKKASDAKEAVTNSIIMPTSSSLLHSAGAATSSLTSSSTASSTMK